MIEINLTELQKTEKTIHVKATSKRKAHTRKIKTAAEADAEMDEKLAALQNYKEAAARTNEWITANPDRYKDVGNINYYTVEDYSMINEVLRDIEPEDEIKISRTDVGEQIQSISSFLSDAPKFDGIVYRGMGFNLDRESSANEYYNFIDNIMKSDVITLKSFTSTSQDKDSASSFAGKTGKDFGKPGGILFEIKSKTGVALDGAAEFSSEREVLFDRNIKFKVVGYNIDSNTQTYHIKLEEL